MHHIISAYIITYRYIVYIYMHTLFCLLHLWVFLTGQGIKMQSWESNPVWQDVLNNIKDYWPKSSRIMKLVDSLWPDTTHDTPSKCLAWAKSCSWGPASHQHSPGNPTTFRQPHVSSQEIFFQSYCDKGIIESLAGSYPGSPGLQ